MTPRARRALALALAIGVGATALLLGLEFDSPRLGAAALERAGRATGLVLDAEAFRLNLLRGLEVEGFTAFGRHGEKVFEVEAERLVFRHRLLPLLAGRLELTSARLDRPRIEVLERPPGAADAPRDGRDWTPTGARARARRRARDENGAAAAGETSAAAAARLRALEVHALRLRGGRLVLAGGPYPGSLAQHARRRAGDPVRPLPPGVTEVDGLDLDLRELRLGTQAERPLAGLAARGRLRADAVRSAALDLRRVDGALALADERLALTDLTFETEAGELRVQELTLRLDDPGLPYALRLRGDPLASHRLLGTADRGGLGSAALAYEGGGAATDPGAAQGSGRLELRAGALPPIPLFVTIDRLTGGSDLVGAPYEPVSIPFRVRGERLEVEPFEVASGPVRLRVEGWTERGGALELDALLRAPRDRVRIDEIPASVLDRMTDEEGRVRLAFRVTGTRDDPEVRPDLPELTRQGRRELRKALEEKLEEGLRRLLRGDDDKEEEGDERD